MYVPVYKKGFRLTEPNKIAMINRMSGSCPSARLVTAAMGNVMCN